MSMYKHQANRQQARRGRSASASQVGTSKAERDRNGKRKPKQDGTQLCGTCNTDPGDTAIGCDECEVWVHDTVMCSGLTQDMIDAIGRYHGQGIKFVCTKCRLNLNVSRDSSPSGKTQPHMVELVAQLFQQMKGICSAVQSLMERVYAPNTATSPGASTTHMNIPSGAESESDGKASMRLNPTKSYAEAASTEPPTRPPPETYRKMVREELRELEEQRKRRSSLVIRGLGAGYAGEAITKFEAVSEHLIGNKVSLTDVVKIPGESDLYRGKVADDEVRKSILDKAKHLKESRVLFTRSC